MEILLVVLHSVGQIYKLCDLPIPETKRLFSLDDNTCNLLAEKHKIMKVWINYQSSQLSHLSILGN